jgi:hypothetical protein
VVKLLRGAVVPLVLVLLISLAGVVAGRIYAGPLLAQLVAGAAVGAVGLSVAARRLPSWTVAPLSVLLLIGYAVAGLRLAADRAGLTDPLAAVLTDAVANGIPRLLTAMIPVEPTPDTVVVPIVAAWLAGLAGAEIAVRAGRVLLGCAPAAILYGGALYVVGPNADAAGWPTLAFAALVAAALAVSGRRTEPTADVPAPARAAVRTRALAGSAAGVAVVIALIALVGPWVGGRVAATPVDPRKYVQPPQVDSLDESPLNRISGWALNPDQHLFDIAPGPVPVAPPPSSRAPKPGASTESGRAGTPMGRIQRLRLAVLPDYDGVTWRVGATYRNAGRVLPTQPALPGGTTERVRQDITVAELTGRLLPVVPTPTGVQGARVAYDVSTGTLIRPEGLTPGLRYTVTSARQVPDLNLLPAAEVPSGPDVARFLTVGAEVPEQIQKLAEQLADDNGAGYDRATAIEQFLSEHYRKVADAPSGHAYPNLSFFLFGPRDQGGQRGTSEQFAASFALLGRLTGLPTRVVVGFAAPAAGGRVTGAEAYAWPEVLFDELGWVAFDPLPQSDQEPRPVEEDFTPKPETPPPTSQGPQPTDEPSASAPPTVLAAAPADGVGPALVGGGVSGTVLLVVGAAAVAVILLRRAQRRRRLFDGAPGERITGAWLEFTDALRLAGRPVPAHLAATEVAALAATAAPTPAPATSSTATATATAIPPPAAATEPGQSVPAVRAALPAVDDLVAGVNTGAFAPSGAGEPQADRAVAQAVAFTEALRDDRSWWRRVLWAVHPGPLRWHRRR